ncbi:hypothetical protein F5Y16DRAFT_373326 [Xylariaceae sp. FL0255]|nr:hypothetical protein F5Y16DRAFT_373326 [Xylariaceae sp. FL0255]
MQPIPNPPEGGPSGSSPTSDMMTVFNSLQQFAKNNGFAIIRRNGRNYRLFAGDEKKIPSTWTICCNRNAVKKSKSYGLRVVTTGKNNCL